MDMNREKLLRQATSGEDRLLLSRLADKAVKAEGTSSVSWSSFLDPRQQNLVEAAFNSAWSDSGMTMRFEGGYEGAERNIAGFMPDVEWDLEDEAPLRLLALRKGGAGFAGDLSHRDYLGALMGLGIKREMIGDILVSAEGAKIVVLADMASFIMMQLDKVGSERVEVSEANLDALEAPERKEREIRGTVMSLRLDAVASLAFSVSRTRMADWIRAEKVTLNWEVQESPAKPVREGDILSIRGKGRALLESLGGVSRKGRTGVVIKRLI